jgi:hypothetical protein
MRWQVDMSKPADPPWGWKDRFFTALIAGFMCCAIAGGTLLI